jgi:hypothetical protein
MSKQTKTITIKPRTMSSLEIAELTGKRPADVHLDIERILEECEIDYAGFKQKYKAANGQTYKCYNLPIKYALLLTSGYNRLTMLKLLESIPDNITEKVIDTISSMDVEDLPVDRFVYVAMMEDSKRIKVGISKHPEERIKQLNVGNPEKLILTHVFKATDAGYLSETKMHRKLKEHNIRSEWFEPEATKLLETGKLAIAS